MRESTESIRMVLTSISGYFTKTYNVTILVLAIAIALFIAFPKLSWSAEDGAALFRAKCAMCHGPDAAGKPAMRVPAVKGKTAADVTKAMELPKHAAVKLNDEQIKAIGDHISSLAFAQGTTPARSNAGKVLEEPADLTEGQTPQEVERILGKPENVTRLKENLIYTYPTVKVFFENRKLVNVEPRDQPQLKPDVQPADVLSTDTLLSRGFIFDDHPRGMCSIKGPDGPCQVEAFVGGESRQDSVAYTCTKLDRASYLGHCVDGALEGVSVVIADGTGKVTREAFVSYFSMGRMAYPALTSWLGENQPVFFGVQEKSMSYGCVVFGRWDSSRTRDSCPRFIDIYGSDIFSESNGQDLRRGTFNLSHYRAKFIEYARGK